jgi:hypothetical protein
MPMHCTCNYVPLWPTEQCLISIIAHDSIPTNVVYISCVIHYVIYLTLIMYGSFYGAYIYLIMVNPNYVSNFLFSK